MFLPICNRLIKSLLRTLVIFNLYYNYCICYSYVYIVGTCLLTPELQVLVCATKYNGIQTNSVLFIVEEEFCIHVV